MPDDEKVIRIAMSVSEIDADRLRRTALEVRTSSAVLARTLVLHGLEQLAAADPGTVAAVEAASEAERARRQRAGSVGGKRGAQTRARTQKPKE